MNTVDYKTSIKKELTNIEMNEKESKRVMTVCGI